MVVVGAEVEEEGKRLWLCLLCLEREEEAEKKKGARSFQIPKEGEREAARKWDRKRKRRTYVYVNYATVKASKQSQDDRVRRSQK